MRTTSWYMYRRGTVPVLHVLCIQAHLQTDYMYASPTCMRVYRRAVDKLTHRGSRESGVGILTEDPHVA